MFVYKNISNIGLHIYLQLGAIKQVSSCFLSQFNIVKNVLNNAARLKTPNIQ